MSAAAIPAVIALAGTAVSAYGQITGAQAQADAEKRKAELDEVQATEIQSREAANEIVMRDSARQREMAVGAEIEASGGSFRGLGHNLEVQRQTNLELSFSNRDAAFKAQMIRAGAQVDLKLASDMSTAGNIGAAGTILAGAGKIGNIFRPNTGAPQQLPQLPQGY